MKRFLAMMLVLMLAAIGASGVALAEEPTKIGVIIASWADQYALSLMQAMQNKAADYPQYEFVYEDGHNDSQTVFTALEGMLLNGCEGMIIFPVDATDGVRIMQICQENGDIPVIGLCRTTENYKEFDGFVDSSYIECGEMCAYELLDILGDISDRVVKVAVLMGRPSSMGTIQRTEGYHNVLDPMENVEFVAAEYAEFDRAKAQTIVETWVTGGIEFDAILSNNDEMAIGASIALEQMGITDIPIIGVDGNEDGMIYVREGKINATAFQNGKGQAECAMEMIHRILSGQGFDEEFPAFQSIPYVMLNSENINDEYYVNYYANLK